MVKNDKSIDLLIWIDLGVPFYYPIRLLAIINHLEAQGWERVIEDCGKPEFCTVKVYQRDG